MKRQLCMVLLGGLFLLPTGCKVGFNFTGGPAPDPNIQTLYIENFGNEADLVLPYLSQEFTETLQETFLNRSRLTLADDAADIAISGSVTGYNIVPMAIAGNEVAEQNRLTIRVRVKYENAVVPEDSWEQTFSSFIDFSSAQNFASIERDLVEIVVEQLTQDIFSRSLGKW